MNSAEIRRIEWLDSAGHSGWHDPTLQTYKPLHAVSVGFCIAEDDESITISSSVIFGEDFQASDAITVPKLCITSDETLTAPTA